MRWVLRAPRGFSITGRGGGADGDEGIVAHFVYIGKILNFYRVDRVFL